MDELELRASRSNVCKVVEDMCICIYISPMKRFNLLHMGNSRSKKVDNFQRNAHGGHLVSQNEANFIPREAFPPMKISCKFDEPMWCSFPLRALSPKISIWLAAVVAA